MAYFFPEVVMKVGPIMNLTFGMIAEHNSSKLKGFDCMHGDSECDADKIQLCVQKHIPTPNYQYFEYVLCANKELKLLPDSAKPCLQLMNVSAPVIDRIMECAYGDEGLALMGASVDYTIQQCGHFHPDPEDGCRSCTMYIQGGLACAHDIGRSGYFNCPTGHTAQDWVRAICEVYRVLNDYHDAPVPACFLDGFTGDGFTNEVVV